MLAVCCLGTELTAILIWKNLKQNQFIVLGLLWAVICPYEQTDGVLVIIIIADLCPSETNFLLITTMIKASTSIDNLGDKNGQ